MMVSATHARQRLRHMWALVRLLRLGGQLTRFSIGIDERTAVEVRAVWDRELRSIAIKMMPGVALLLLAWNFVDYSLNSRHLFVSVLWRCTAASITFVLWFMVIRSKHNPARARIWVLLSIIAIQTEGLAILATNDPTTYSSQLYGLVLVIFGSAVTVPWDWKYPAFIVAYTLAGYAALHVYYTRGFDVFVFGFIFVAGTAGLSLTALYFQNREAIRGFITKQQAQQALDVVQEARARNQVLMEDLQRLTLEDPLTQIANRRAFHDFLDRQLTEAAQQKTSVGLIMLDIDHFKKLNDSFGHQIGDEVLREVATALSQRIRSHDLVARYGGEEFVIVTPGMTSRRLAQFAEELRNSIWPPAENSSLLNYMSIEEVSAITLSAGAAQYPLVANSAHQLVKAADEALYYAKNHGRNQSHLAATAPSTASPELLTHIAAVQIPAAAQEIPQCPDTASDDTKPTLGAYFEEITPAFKIFAQGAAILAFFLLGSWIIAEYFFRHQIFHQFYYLRFIAQLYMIPDFLYVRHPKTKYKSMAIISLGAMLAIQIDTGLPLPLLGNAFDESLLILTMVIFAGAICLPWHWKFSLYLSGCTVVIVLISHTFVHPGFHIGELFRALFLVVSAGIFAVIGHYARFNIGWSEFVARQTLVKARAAAEKQHRENTAIVHRLAELTRLDALTQVANRRAFDEHMDERIADAHHEESHFALIMMDIDHFKRLNDTYGHQTGDRVLCEVAQALQERLPHNGFIARYGGEEFVIVAPDIEATQLHDVVDVIRQDISRDVPLAQAGRELAGYGLTLSAGVAMWPVHGSTADELVQVADSHLYAAKNSGRNRTVTATLSPVPSQTRKSTRPQQPSPEKTY